MPAPNPIAIFAPRLNATGACWMVVGSIASSAYGEYRTTHDVDVIIAIDADAVESFASSFPLEEFYCPPPDVIRIEAARAQRGHFNLIHHETGFKADIYPARSEQLQVWAMKSRRQVSVGGAVGWIAPPEYVIIGKLEFYREGGIEKHLRDIRSMLAVTDVDRSIVEQEVARRGLAEQWALCCS